jgi:hypothetical protein
MTRTRSSRFRPEGDPSKWDSGREAGDVDPHDLPHLLVQR